MLGQAGNRQSDDYAGDGRECLNALLAGLKGVTRFSVDAPADPTGEWFLDFVIDGFATSVAWKRDRGFGIFSSGVDGIGSRPDEIFRDASLASRRLLQLADAAKRHRNPRLRLGDVRLLVNERQAELAERLNVGQGVISRLESRNDAKLSTIYEYVEALGGRAVLMVRFDDFEAPIELNFGSGASNDIPRTVPA